MDMTAPKTIQLNVYPQGEEEAGSQVVVTLTFVEHNEEGLYYTSAKGSVPFYEVWFKTAFEE